MVCGAGDDAVKLDANDVIADATADDSNGSCEDVQRAGAQEESDADSRPEGRDGRDCPGKEEEPAPGQES